MAKTFSWQVTSTMLLICVAAIAAQAQITQLYDFQGEGSPTSGVIQGFDGNLYGTTFKAVYKLPPVQFATDTLLYKFCSKPACSDGSAPAGGVIQATNGNFYGVTFSGGSGCTSVPGCGTVYKLTPTGKLTTLHRFDGTDGAGPMAGVIQGSDGNFYGTTYNGGANEKGTVFKMAPGGKLTTLYSFCTKAKCADGANPRAALVEGTDGNYYGTTYAGGAANVGTVFKISASGGLTVLHGFSKKNGANPLGGLMQASDGNFYGTTYAGGAYGLGALFEITSAGTLTTLWSFCGVGAPLCADGANPDGGVVQTLQGSFWGTASMGGARGVGTIFEYSGGSLAAQYDFCSAGECADGEYPEAGLAEGTDGNLYGTTQQGGGGPNAGTVFSIWSGDGAFVRTNPTSGKAGSAVKVLGNSLKGTTAVTFNGQAAAFKVVSGSEISTKVPAGATTGEVEVTTPSGTVSSNVAFRVIP